MGVDHVRAIGQLAPDRAPECAPEIHQRDEPARRTRRRLHAAGVRQRFPGGNGVPDPTDVHAVQRFLATLPAVARRDDSDVVTPAAECGRQGREK